jgi:hypothetical protein
MATLIRIGKHSINLDQVTDVTLVYENSVQIGLVGSEAKMAFYGAEAAALRWYLECEATDVVALHAKMLEGRARRAEACARGEHDWIGNDHGSLVCSACGRSFEQSDVTLSMMEGAAL